MKDKKIIELCYVGKDAKQRPVYKDQHDRLWKDTSFGACPEKNLRSTANNYFDGEPGVSMRYISRYQDAKIVFVNQDIMAA